MKTRQYRDSDEPILKAAYLRRGFEGGWRPMDGVITATVVVDENDYPVAMVAAHPVAEVRAVIDPEWASPAWRKEALIMAHDAVLSDLKKQGYCRATALLEGTVGKGLGRRMQGLRGWFLSRGTAWEKEL
jgi:hypothetical protein